LITGVNSGIGLATALRVAKLGFRSVGSVRSQTKADLVAEAAARAGVSVETVILDVADPVGCERVMDETRPWGLVNNAGYGGLAAVEDVGDDEARRVMETMVFAPMRLSRLALSHMRVSGDGGRIVNMSSILGRTTFPLTGWYSAAKHALEVLSDALRVEVASAGVAVVLVEPGGFRTKIWDDLAVEDAYPDSKFAAAYARSRTALRLAERFMGPPSHVAVFVGHALTARHPRDRYLVGMDAAAMSLAQLVTPIAVRDRVSRIGLGL
jgi:NAD(P)-dependent dehydrogenase (short-subunit alcohol dehydrogenase family)